MSKSQKTKPTLNLSGNLCAAIFLTTQAFGNSNSKKEALRTTIYCSLEDTCHIAGLRQLGIELPSLGILFTCPPGPKLNLQDMHVAQLRTLQNIWERLTKRGVILQQDLFTLVDDTGESLTALSSLLQRVKLFHSEVVEREKSLDMSVQDGHLVPVATHAEVFISSQMDPAVLADFLKNIR